jgi:hypothetical protein
MKIWRLEAKLEALLPLYLTGRLSPFQRRAVEAWLRRSEPARARLDALRRIRTAVSEDRRAAGLPALWPRLNPAARTDFAPPSRGLSPRWAAGMALGLLLLAFAWIALPPVVELQWSVAGANPVEFRIYRADGSDSASFELVEAIPAGERSGTYQFRDFLLIPGGEYVYRIEAIGPNDQAVAQQRVTGDSSLLLPGQIALLAAVLISLYGVWVYATISISNFRMLHQVV